MNANQFQAGIGFFEDLLQQHGAQLPPEKKALYLSALGVLPPPVPIRSCC
ncbi:MAG: hypothetical protein M8364_16055 [Methylobacter sp.]|nr:hypothetical protein [Methylobacter sp.]MCL7422405.1 hypothetical protein [Methylobacter sp.]